MLASQRLALPRSGRLFVRRTPRGNHSPPTTLPWPLVSSKCPDRRLSFQARRECTSFPTHPSAMWVLPRVRYCVGRAHHGSDTVAQVPPTPPKEVMSRQSVAPSFPPSLITTTHKHHNTTPQLSPSTPFMCNTIRFHPRGCPVPSSAFRSLLSTSFIFPTALLI